MSRDSKMTPQERASAVYVGAVLGVLVTNLIAVLVQVLA